MSDSSDTADPEAIERQQIGLATQRERLAILLAQHAHFGAYAPPHIISDIRATQEALRPIKGWLHAKDIAIAGRPPFH